MRRSVRPSERSTASRSVEYDCKVATVTMKNGAVLTEREASKVIRDAGYKVVSFKAASRPS